MMLVALVGLAGARDAAPDGGTHDGAQLGSPPLRRC